MEQYLKTLFSKEEYYIRESWYKQIKKRNITFKRLLLTLSLTFLSLYPLSQFLFSFIQGKFENTTSFSIILFGLLLIFISLRLIKKEQNIKRLLWFSLLLMLFGFYRSSIPSLLYLAISPIISTQILGCKKGSIFSGITISAYTVFLLLSMFSIIPAWEVATPTILRAILLYGSFFCIWYISLSIENHHRENLNLMVKTTLFDRVTHLPGQKVLRSRIATMDSSIFAILKIINFSDLGLIFGYELSDKVLTHVSEFLTTTGIKMGFSVYRLRGHEFGILKETGIEFDQEKSTIFLTSLSKKINDLIIHWKDSHLTLNTVIGGTLVYEGDKEYLSHADQAVNEGIDRHVPVILFSDKTTFRESVISSMHHYSTLKDHLESNSLQVHYQPIIDSLNSEVIWYETLLRVENKEGELSSPIPYLNIAESTGLDRHISDFVLKEACKALKVLKTHISINITFNDLRRPDFLEKLIKYYPKNQEGEGRLILEILERQELHTLESCQSFLKTAKDLGCLIAIDDFGSGYSNYCNVLQIPVDIIKIDGSLVQQMKGSERARVLVDNIIQFSQKLDLKVVAEYVDTPEIADHLRQSGVDFLQGWLYGKASPISSFSENKNNIKEQASGQ